MENGRAIASSEGDIYEEDLIDKLVETNVIDAQAAKEAKGIFVHGGEGSFICEQGYKTDNICATHLLDHDLFWFRPFQRA